MADTTLNPEDLLKLDSVKEGFLIMLTYLILNLNLKHCSHE